MYNFTAAQRGALAAKPSTAAVLAIERWVEITYEDTHPYWRCRPEKVRIADGAARLDAAVRTNSLNDVPACVALVSGALLANGFGRDWQYNAVKTYLLDPVGEFSSEDFLDRLRTLASGKSTQGAEVGGPVTLEWRISERLPAAARLPWRDPGVTLGHEKQEYAISERGKGFRTAVGDLNCCEK